MKKKFTVTEQDYFNYQWHLFRHNPTARRTMRIQMLLPIVVFIAITIYYLVTKKPLRGLLPLGVVLVLWPFVYQFFFNRSMKKRLKRLIKKMKDELPIGDHHVEVDEEGIRDGKLTIPYATIRYVIDSENDFYYIFHGESTSAYLLPKELGNEKIRDRADG